MKKGNTQWLMSLIIIGLVFIFSNNRCQKDNGSSSNNKDTTQNGNNGTVTDIDGNIYKTVKIGTQIWMAENLKVTKYKNGIAIPNASGNNAWITTKTGAYCDYANIPSNSQIYGRLYNWYAVNTGNLAPSGWHVPTNAEWGVLKNYLGNDTIVGGKLKEKGTIHWATPNIGATNESGFTALPGGVRTISSGVFYSINTYTVWWSSTDYDTADAYVCNIKNNNDELYFGGTNKNWGCSVRCVKD